MALLTEKEIQKRLKFLGYKNLREFQKVAFPGKKKWHDNKNGPITDPALRHFYNVEKCTKDFKPEEFRCSCGRCSGYPTFMRSVELRHIQKIRDHYGKPMTITSALRCSYENSRVNGVKNSGHLKGYAVDFYMKGVTETPEQRTAALKWIKGLPNHQFSYGAYIVDTEGKYWASGQMGNALHTETHKPAKTEKKSKYYNVNVVIGEARCNEFGKLSGGKPGDQTGKEVGMGNWYNGTWLYMFRAKDASIRDKLAQAMIETCNNSNIGYNIDKPNRYAAWDNAEANEHNIKGIKSKGDTTCSQAVSMCMRAVGIPKAYAPRHCDIAALTKVMTGNNPYFTKYSAKDYTRKSGKLLPGDILLSSHHTLIVVKSPNAK